VILRASLVVVVAQLVLTLAAMTETRAVILQSSLLVALAQLVLTLAAMTEIAIPAAQ
jgi:hypothetical protein